MMRTLLQYLSPPLKLVDNGQLLPLRRGAPVLPAVRLVPRHQCSFERVVLASRGNEALRAAEWRAKRNSLFDDAEALCVRDRDGALEASVWCWPRDDSGLNDRRFAGPVLPETAARMTPSDGASLIQCIQGFEGQVVRNGALIASRWWSNPPDPAEWAVFLRSAGMGLTETTPHASRTSWRNFLPPFDSDPRLLRAAATPQRAAIASLAVIMALCLFRSGELVRLELEQASLNRYVAENAERLADARQLRRDALRAVSEIERVASAGLPEQTVFALSDLFTSLPGQARFVNFQLVRGELRAEIESSAPIVATELVEDLEQSPWLDGVSVSGSRDANRFQITIQGLGDQ